MYCRCSNSKCQHRKTLAMHPDRYAPGRIPRCDVCGSRKWRVDRYRQSKERGPGAHNCKCYLQPHLGGLYWFPHRRGSLVCAHNPGFTVAVAEKWAKDRGLT